MMKKRFLTAGLTVMLTAALLAGCGGSQSQSAGGASDSTGTENELGLTAEEEELKGWIDEAYNQYYANSVYGNNDEVTYVDEDGNESTWTSSTTCDTQKKIVMDVSIDADGSEDISYYTEEDGTTYAYEPNSDDTANQNTQYYKMPREDYSWYISNEYEETEVFEDSDLVEYVDVSLSNEGEEDGLIKIKADIQSRSKTNATEEITRESVLEMYDLTEEDLELIDGASEALDAYVKENEENTKASNEEIAHKETIYWITKDTHELVKTQDNYEKPSEETEETDEAYNAWDDMQFMIQEMKEYMDIDNMSQEEALALAKEDLETWNDQREETSGVSWVSTYTTTYIVGDDCRAIGELPENVTEITEEQYESGEY